MITKKVCTRCRRNGKYIHEVSKLNPDKPIEFEEFWNSKKVPTIETVFGDEIEHLCKDCVDTLESYFSTLKRHFR